MAILSAYIKGQMPPVDGSEGIKRQKATIALTGGSNILLSDVESCCTRPRLVTKGSEM